MGGGGGGGGGGRERDREEWGWGGGGFQPKKRKQKKKKKKKNNRYSLIFYAHAVYKISSSWLKWFSSFNTNKRSNGQVRGITLPMFYRITVFHGIFQKLIKSYKQ